MENFQFNGRWSTKDLEELLQRRVPLFTIQTRSSGAKWHRCVVVQNKQERCVSIALTCYLPEARAIAADQYHGTFRLYDMLYNVREYCSVYPRAAEMLHMFLVDACRTNMGLPQGAYNAHHKTIPLEYALKHFNEISKKLK